MTKRERTSLLNKLNKLEAKIAKRRDELRKDVEQFECLLESVNEATDELDNAIMYVRSAKEAVDDAADSLSQYV